MSSCERPLKRSASEALPASVSNRYSLSIRTHGSSCRRRATSSLRRVSSFSASSSSSRAASHSSRVPVMCFVIALLLPVVTSRAAARVQGQTVAGTVAPFAYPRGPAGHPRAAGIAGPRWRMVSRKSTLGSSPGGPNMIRPSIVTAAAAAAVVIAAAPGAGAAESRSVVTVYTHDLGFVHEWRTLTLAGARDTVRIADVPESIDVPSVRLAPGAGRVARLAYRYDVATGDGLFDRARGSRVRVTLRGDRAVEGTLLASDGMWVVVRETDGGLRTLSRTSID